MNPWRCPKCTSDLPAASVLVLRTWRLPPWWWRALATLLDLPIEPLVSVKSGDRVVCQGCGHCYSIGPNGTFQHFEPPSANNPRIATGGNAAIWPGDRPKSDDKPPEWKPSIPPPRPAPPL